MGTKKSDTETEGKQLLSPFSELNFTQGTSRCLVIATGYTHSLSGGKERCGEDWGWGGWGKCCSQYIGVSLCNFLLPAFLCCDPIPPHAAEAMCARVDPQWAAGNSYSATKLLNLWCWCSLCCCLLIFVPSSSTCLGFLPFLKHVFLEAHLSQPRGSGLPCWAGWSRLCLALGSPAASRHPNLATAEYTQTEMACGGAEATSF